MTLRMWMMRCDTYTSIRLRFGRTEAREIDARVSEEEILGRPSLPLFTECALVVHVFENVDVPMSFVLNTFVNAASHFKRT